MKKDDLFKISKIEFLKTEKKKRKKKIKLNVNYNKKKKNTQKENNKNIEKRLDETNKNPKLKSTTVFD